MRKMYIKELRLCSFKEKSALNITFKSAKTLLLGSNDTGKSCIVKSIYHTLGAEAQFEQVWKDADVKSVVKFEIDGKDYSVLRDGSVFSIYNSQDEHLHTYTSVTKELGPFLATLFKFGLTLTSSSSGKNETPVPAFMYLPYYIDQDLGWTNSFNSFERLGQYSDWRTPTIEYHTGIRPDEFYRLAAEKREKQDAKKENSTEKEILDRVIRTQRERYSGTYFDLDVAEFESEIKILIESLGGLKKAEDKFRLKALHLYDARRNLESQRDTANAVLKGKRKDFEYAAENDSLVCPICATEFENSFEERLHVANDISDVDTLVLELNRTLIEISDEIKDAEIELHAQSAETKHIEDILGKKKEQVAIRDILLSEGKKEILKDLQEQSFLIDEKVLNLEDDLKEIKRQMSQYEDADRKKKINDFYLVQMKNLLPQLQVGNVKESSYDKLTSKVRKSGSDQPRALLSYFFSVIRTIAEYGSATFCPIVIDSPNQQAQDDENIKIILEKIPSLVPNEAQLILALESQHDVEFPGEVITLENKYHVLRPEKFETESVFFKMLFDQRVGVSIDS